MMLNLNDYGKHILQIVMNTVKPKIKEESAIVNSTSLDTINSNTNFMLGNHNFKNYINSDGTSKYDWCEMIPPKYGNRKSAFCSTKLATIAGDILYPIDVKGKYFRANISLIGEPIESEKEYGYFYFGVKCYDAEKRFITHYMSYPWGQQTYIVEPLKKGDTKLYLYNASNFVNWEYINDKGVDVYGHMRTLLFHPLQDNGKYCYKSPEGTYYSELGYSRLCMYNGYKGRAIKRISPTKYEITLSRPWDGPDLPKGTKCRNTRSGGTYNYWLSYRYFKLDRKEYNICSSWRSFDPNNIYDFGIFRNGTHYVSTLLLTHYGWRDKDGHSYPYSNDDFYEKANGKFKVCYTSLKLEYKPQG